MTDSFWRLQARALINQVTRDLPATATLKVRMHLIDEAYPFGMRGSPSWPYKCWLKERRAHLVKHGYRPRTSPAKNQLELLPRDPVTGRPVI